eukprot:GHVN01026737.1.p1 GENE.GHVN01026737.1~~GHVN01026737.1.p1  ORF type:complete len:376 (+),score=72.04 GHVN01026737.1:26-1129(+)
MDQRNVVTEELKYEVKGVGGGEVKGVGGGEVRGLSVETIAEATKILKEKGFVIIRGALSASEVKQMKNRMHCDETKNDDSSSTYQRLLYTDCNLYRHVVPVGRTHLLIRTSLFEQLPLSYQHRWLPLVYTHLKSEVFNSSTALESWASQGHRMRNWVAHHLKHDQTDDAGMIPGSPQNPTQRIYLSCLRLIIADPLASRTSWHRDRERPGVTVLIPLVNVSSHHPVNGTNVVVPGTHHLRLWKGDLGARWGRPVKNKEAYEEQWLECEGGIDLEMHAGDALIHDATLLHRARENDTFLSRPCLRYIYNFESMPSSSEYTMASVGWQLRKAHFLGAYLNLVSRYSSSVKPHPSVRKWWGERGEKKDSE